MAVHRHQITNANTYNLDLYTANSRRMTGFLSIRLSRIRITLFLLSISMISKVSSGFLIQPYSIHGLQIRHSPALLATKNESSEGKQKLSRSERKALERAKKQATPSRKTSIVGPVDLDQNSSHDQVMSTIKKAQNAQSSKALEDIERFLSSKDSSSLTSKGSILARLAVAALQLNEVNMATRVIKERKKDFSDQHLPAESAAIVRGLLRNGKVEEARELLEDEIPILSNEMEIQAYREYLKHRSLALVSIASHQFFDNDASEGVALSKLLAELGPKVREAGLSAEDLGIPWTKLLKAASQCESNRRSNPESSAADLPCNVVYSVLNAMTTFPSENSDLVYEILANALVRRTTFITGAVGMDGCPAPDRGEAVFIGRSNVGKSSLVNMVTNRKSLAYISKRPGKTQQFNYFAVNDKPGREKEVRYGDVLPGEKDADSFYIVDIPGFGYAKVPEAQRIQWADFTEDYLSTRRTLRVVFHLVDGRHGPTDEDALIMNKINEKLPPYVRYVVVLTKADKNVKGPATRDNAGKVTESVMRRVRQVMQENGVGSSPVILTSAETKLGRDDIWRYLRLAAEG